MLPNPHILRKRNTIIPTVHLAARLEDMNSMDSNQNIPPAKSSIIGR